jgi:DNA-binding winged helix-turn-helix (wHTH) protein/Flp pilus assembly protein TadD
MHSPDLGTVERGGLVYGFGPFRLDVQRECLIYGVEKIPLPDRLFQILLALVQANGRVVTREQLRTLLWPDDAVPDNNLSQHVYMLRRVLGERAGDRLYIATAHGKGFRFVAPVRPMHSSTILEPPVERKTPEVRLREPDLAVFRNFSRASKLLDVGTGTDLRSAVELLAEAVTIDARYVPAWVGLARARLLLVQYGYSSKQVEYSQARDAVSKALEMDAGSAAAHAVLANLVLFCDWNWREAHRELDAAVQLNPESSIVRTSAAWVHAWMGHPDRAAMEAKRALMAEPSSTALQLFLGRMLICCGDFAGATAHLSEVIQSSPQFALPARRWRALALLMCGRPHDALLDLTLMPEDRAEDLAARLSLLGQAYASLDDKPRAEQIYERLVTIAQVEFVSELSLVFLALALGDPERAVTHLEKATRQREPMLPVLRTCPMLKQLKMTSAFKQLANEIGTC